MCSVHICIVLHYRTAEYYRKKVKDFNGQHCRLFIPATHPKMLLFVDKMKTSCNNIHMKMNISFTLSSRYIWQRNFSPAHASNYLILTALLNAAMKCIFFLCKMNATVSSSLCIKTFHTHIYMEKTFFPKGCFLLFCCLFYVFDSCNERGSMEGLSNQCMLCKLLAGWLVLRLFYVILK